MAFLTGHISYIKYDPDKHHRRSIRLPGYDYSQAGYYFVTICCDRRQELFGEIVDGVMQLNQYGEIVADTCKGTQIDYSFLANLDRFKTECLV